MAAGCGADHGHGIADRLRDLGKMSVHLAKPEHQVLYQELIQLVNKHPGVSALEFLAIAANMVGKIVAMQDQRTCTREYAMLTIAENVEAGNRQVLEEMQKTKGSA